MIKLPQLTTRKKYFLVFFLVIGLLATMYLYFQSQRRQQLVPTPSGPPGFDQINRPINEEFVLPDYTQVPQKNGEPDLTAPRTQTAIAAKQKLLPSLPIYIPNFFTSVNQETTINIYALPSDLEYLIHIDIYGIDYESPSLDEATNPNITAFKESFLKAEEEIGKRGVNIKDLLFIFGGRTYIQETAELWIDHFNLLR